MLSMSQSVFCSPDSGTVPGPRSPVRRPIRSTGEKAETALNGQEGEGGGKLLSGVLRSDRQTDRHTDRQFPPPPSYLYSSVYLPSTKQEISPAQKFPHSSPAGPSSAAQSASSSRATYYNDLQTYVFGCSVQYYVHIVRAI